MFSRRVIQVAGCLAVGVATALSGQAPDSTEKLPLKTTRSVKFTTTEGTWLDLDVSPDGRTIVFEMLGDLYTLPISGGKATRITSGQAYDAQPRYSPDGTRLVFISDRSGGENVWVSNADGSGLKRVSRGETNRFQSPEWTPDGYIVVSKGRSESFSPFPSRQYDQRSYDLFLYDLNGGTGVKLDIKTGSNFLGAAFGSDPRYLYVTGGSTGGGLAFDRWTVVLFDRQTGVSTTRVRRGGSALRPVVSPDNRWLVYGSRYEDGQALRVRDLRTGDERLLLADAQRDEQEGIFSRDLMPGSSFTPDGQALIMYKQGHIWRIELASGKATQIPFTADVDVPAGPLVRFDYRLNDSTFTAQQIRGARPSPDGTKLAFSALNRIWVMELPSGTPRRLTAESAAGEHEPTWSPDGRYLAYIGWREGDVADAGGDIYRVAVPTSGTGSPERLTRERAFYERLAFSPDGRRLVMVRGSRQSFVEDGTGDVDLVWIPAEGGDAQRIAPGIRGLAQFTAADTSRIWLDSGDELISIRWDGFDRRTELKVPGGSSLRISRDGQRVALLAGPGPQAYVIARPQLPGVSVSVVSPEGAPVPVKKVTKIGAAFLDWSDQGTKFHYSLGRSFFTHDVTRSDSGATSRVNVSLSVTADRPSGAVLLRGARIITMKNREIIEKGDVLVNGNRIVAVGRQGSVSAPRDAKVYDVSGKTIMPGYIDTHGHFMDFGNGGLLRNQAWQYLIMLAYGVTADRDPSTGTDIFGYADLIDAGSMLGPRVWASGPAIQGAQNIASQDDARNVITRYGEFFNTRYIKQYGPGERQVRQWLIMAAAEKNITAVTEPYYDVKKDVTDALDGYPEMGHGWPIFPIYNDLVQVMAQTGMTHTATLTTTFGGPKGRTFFFTRRSFHDDRKLRRFMPHDNIDNASLRQPGWYSDKQYIMADHGRGIKKMMDAGVNVAMGAHGDFMGLGYHWELEMHAMGGIPMHDILLAATINGAKAIGLARDLGSIEPGKLADLQVLDRNPLDGVQNTLAIRYVMKNGRLYDAETMDEVWPRPRKLGRMWWWDEDPVAATSSAAGAGSR